MENSINEPNNEKDKQLLVEYQLGSEGYKYRDAMIPQELYQMTQIIAFFTALIGVMLAYGGCIAFLISLLLFFIGLFALASFMIDIEANVSCKRVLRRRLAEIETQIAGFRYWITINQRKPFKMEEMSKVIFEWLSKRMPLNINGAASDVFILTARLLLFFWVLLNVFLFLSFLFWDHIPSIKG